MELLKNILYQFRWLFIFIAIAIPVAIVANYFISKDEISTWADDLPAMEGPRPWGATGYSVNLSPIKEASPSWAAAFEKGINRANFSLHKKFRLKPRICILGNGSCEHSKFNAGSYPTNVQVRPAPRRWNNWGGFKKRNLCEEVKLGDSRSHAMAMLWPTAREKKSGRVGHIFIFVCVNKWNKMLLLAKSPTAEKFKRLGKYRIAYHEVMHLFFHKHPTVGGGIAHADPGISGDLDNNGELIFTTYMYMDFWKAGFIENQTPK